MEILTSTIEVSGDDAPLPLYIAEPKSAGRLPALVVFMEAFGVNAFIKEIAERLAREGYFTIVPDMYYRFGKGITAEYDDIMKVLPLFRGTHDLQINADVRIVVDYIKSLARADAGRMGCVGFCNGGDTTWLSMCLNRDFKAGALYYPGGMVSRALYPGRPVSPHEYAPLLSAPLLGNFGELDQHPSPADVEEVGQTLSKLGKVHDFKIYKGVGHGFSRERYAGYDKPAADDAWARTVGWFDKYLKA